MQIILKASEIKIAVALKEVHLDYQPISMSHKINTLKSYTVYSVSGEIKMFIDTFPLADNCLIYLRL